MNSFELYLLRYYTKFDFELFELNFSCLPSTQRQSSLVNYLSIYLTLVTGKVKSTINHNLVMILLLLIL